MALPGSTGVDESFRLGYFDTGEGTRMTEKEQLAALLLECGALTPASEEALPLRWNADALTASVRAALLKALLEMIQDHYAAAEAVFGADMAAEVAKALELPLNPPGIPRTALIVTDTLTDGADELRTARPLKDAGCSAAVAAVFQYGLPSARAAMDLADVRVHWLTDMESAAAVGLQNGSLTFEEYEALLGFTEVSMD